MTKERLVKPDKIFKFTDLFLDFLERKGSLNQYFPADDPLPVAGRLEQAKVDRNLLADLLVRQNAHFGAKPATFRAIEKFRREETLCIFSGQQAGLFGGPLFTLYKAVGIVKQAERLEKILQRKVVPVFWVAADDHDFAEINHIEYLSQQGEISSISYDSPPAQEVPAAEMLFDNQKEYDKIHQLAKEAYGATEFTPELYSRLFEAYTFGAGFVDAFARYLLNILPDFGLIIFSPADKEVKTASKGFFKRLIEGHFRIKELLDKTGRQLRKDSYHLQVEKKESATHLFYHNPGRIPLHAEGDYFLVGEKRLGLPGLLDLIDKTPEKFSPDVLSRPLWQSYLFPVVAQMAGPSEIAYFAQASKLFEAFGLIQPYYYFRPSNVLVEKRNEELLEKYDLRLSDFAGDIETIINRVSLQSFPKEVESAVADFRNRLERLYDEFLAAVKRFDETLEPMGKQTYGKIDFAVNGFEKKIFDHHKKKVAAVRSQIYRLTNALYPNRILQERVYNINYFIAKYGYSIVDFIVQKTNVESGKIQMIYLSEMPELK